MKVKGFTLIEMVMTLIVGSILVLGIAGFVELGARGDSDTVERQRLQTQAKFILEKISREVRHAVPNMLNSNLTIAQANSCISFYPIVDSGFYAQVGNGINFVLGQRKADGTGTTQAELSGLNMVINPTEAVPTNNVFSLVTVTSNNNTFSLANATLVGNSVSQRHYIYDPSGMVSYCLVGGRLMRSVNQANALPLSDLGVSGTLSYLPANVQHNGVVDVDLTFSNQVGDESTNFMQEIQVLNVP